MAAEQTLNDPIRIAQGVYPGRVVWIHDPNATDWAGYSSPEHWYDDNHTDQAVVDKMISRAVRGLAGESSEQLSADIAPSPFGDGIVDMEDLALFVEYWTR